MRVEEAALPEPGPGQVRFRVEGTGVCASNLGNWFGMPWTRYPLGPGESGHEAWGVVDALGPGVRGISEGDRVAAISYDAYAEYDVAGTDAVVKLPAFLGADPFPGEALGCAMNIFARSRIEAGQTVAVVGAGFLGSILIRLASDAGARVLAVSRSRHSLALAARMGASEALSVVDPGGTLERVSALTQGKLCERVIEATGKQQPLDLAAALTGTRGTLVIAGYHQDGPRQVNLQMWNYRGIDVVNAHERDVAVYVRGVEAALDAIASARLDPRPLYTHRYSLEELGAALEATAERPDGFVKALVMP
ncbi:MAG TPA: zinc-binding dehydrogenase [Polyangiaceae bacterium]|nr:zinc-binding dehydrogenase [Polyangiaceae bacterium]